MPQESLEDVDVYKHFSSVMNKIMKITSSLYSQLPYLPHNDYTLPAARTSSVFGKEKQIVQRVWGKKPHLVLRGRS